MTSPESSFSLLSKSIKSANTKTKNLFSNTEKEIEELKTLIKTNQNQSQVIENTNKNIELEINKLSKEGQVNIQAIENKLIKLD